MGFFGKLAFWKKKDDFDLGKDFGADLGLAPMQPMGPDLGFPPNAYPARQRTGLEQNMNLGMPDDIGFGSTGRLYPSSMQPPGQPSPMQQPFGAPMQPQPPTEKDYQRDKFEVVSAKLDSIRYTLESINQRLTNIERIAYGEQEKKRGW